MTYTVAGWWLRLPGNRLNFCQCWWTLASNTSHRDENTTGSEFSCSDNSKNWSSARCKTHTLYFPAYPLLPTSCCLSLPPPRAQPNLALLLLAGATVTKPNTPHSHIPLQRWRVSYPSKETSIVQVIDIGAGRHVAGIAAGSSRLAHGGSPAAKDRGQELRHPHKLPRVMGSAETCNHSHATHSDPHFGDATIMWFFKSTADSGPRRRRHDWHCTPHAPPPPRSESGRLVPPLPDSPGEHDARRGSRVRIGTTARPLPASGTLLCGI